MQSVDPRAILKAFVGKYSTQQAAAEDLAISAAYLSDLLNGRRDINDLMLKKLGLKRIVVKA